MAEVVDALINFPRVYALSQREFYEKVIADIRDGNTDAVNRDLFQSYSENLRRGISGVLGQDQDGDKYLDMRLQFDANAARFAAYKAYHATQQLERQLSDSDGVARSPEDFERMAKAVLNTFNRYQAAEYNTAVSRARTAKQWTDFSDPDHAFLFPNLRWLPSRSATPREQHMPFYNRVWAKTDPFWNSNQPGNLWNCKCDWEETDDPVTGDNPEGIKPAKGLEGNPAETGQIFTDQCTYVQKAGQNRDQRDIVEKQCESAARDLLKKTAKQSPLLSKTCQCEIDGSMQDVHFSEWGISETSQSMFGKKRVYWLKNEVLSDPDSHFRRATYVGDAEVDLSHNTNRKTLRLKRKFRKYYYCQTTLANGQTVYLNIVLHDDGNYYLYTISKEIHEY